MTPEVRAATVATTVGLHNGDFPSRWAGGAELCILNAIRAAVSEEREAIKKLVATHLNDGAQTDDGISADRTAASILYAIEQRSAGELPQEWQDGGFAPPDAWINQTRGAP